MQPYLAEIRMFAGNFAPRAWALCQGQILPINQNQALFSLLGTTYGGDGRTTFALPDMRGRAAMGTGHGPGLTDRPLGQKSGTETNTLTTNNLAQHSHSVIASNLSASMPVSVDAPSATGAVGHYLTNQSNETYASNATANQFLKEPEVKYEADIMNTGNQQPLNNMGPYNTLNYIICLQGIFPSRS